MIRRPTRHRRTGQALVEFALILIPFLFLLLGIVDLGRGIVAANGAAQAAREIARTTSVHPGLPLGSSPETGAAIAAQRAIVLGMADPGATVAFACTNGSGTVITGRNCINGDFVRVDVRIPFQVLTPLLNMVSPLVLGSTSHVEIP